MRQLNIIEKKMELFTPTKCVFTGHRDLGRDFSEKALKNEIEKLILRGVTDFYNGGAVGFDMVAAETVIKLKKKYPQIRLIICIPCYNQEKNYQDKDKNRYVKILEKADEKILLCDHYYNGCMLVRDKYMVERAEIMITYCKRNTGGTAYTVGHFQKIWPNGEIIFL